MSPFETGINLAEGFESDPDLLLSHARPSIPYLKRDTAFGVVQRDDHRTPRFGEFDGI